MDASDIASFRSATAGLCLVPWFAGAQVRSTTRIAWPKILLSTLLIGPVFVLLGVGGFAHAQLAHGALVQPAVLMVGTMILAAWLSDTPVTKSQTVSVMILVFGLICVIAPSLAAPSRTMLLGNAMFAASALM